MSDSQAENKVANPIGRPSKYSVEMPDRLIGYFNSLETFVFMDKTYPKIKTKAGFCADNLIAKATFDRWCEAHEEFRGAWNIAKQMQANQIHNLTANRIIDGNYGKLLAINCTDMKDKVEHTIDKAVIAVNIDKEDEKL